MSRRVDFFRRLGIRQRVLLVALAPMVLVGLGLVFYFTFLRYGDVEAALANRGGAMAHQLAPASEYGLFSGNVAELTRLSQAMLAEPDVSGVAFFDPDGRLLARAGDLRSSLDPTRQNVPWTGETEDGLVLIYHVRVSRNPVDYDDPFALEQPIRAAPGLLGTLTLEISRERVLASKREILIVSLGAVLSMMVVAMLLASRLGRDITVPLVRLEEAVARLRRGQLNTRVSPHIAGTVSGLEEGFNEMASALEAANARLSAALASSEAELQDQYEFATALLQALSDAGVGILILRAERIVFANEAAATIHGIPHAELLAISDWTQLLPESNRLSLKERADQVRYSNWTGNRFESAVLVPGDVSRYVDVVMTRLEGEPGEFRVVMVETEVTERRHAEERLNVANRELEAQRDDARRANQAKSRFLAAASHDLRQPIQALTLFVGELRRQASSPSQRRLSKQIQSAVQLLVELLDTLLEISRIDIQELQPRLRPLALDGWLESIAVGYGAAAKEKGLALRVRSSSLTVMTDPVLLARIVGNLLSNAVRYTRSGRILLGVRRVKGCARIEVWDSGVGVGEEHIPHLFQEFYQVENPERDAAKGLGLGLSIVDRLSTVLNHPISVRSWPGQGSVFAVTVPFSTSSLPVEDGIEGEEEIAEAKSVLLLLGNWDEALTLAAMMEDWGYQVVCPDSTEALKRAVKDLPGVLICEDSQLPALDAELPRDGEGRFDLVILGEETRSLRHGSLFRTEYLTNPPRPARLRALLQHLTSGEVDDEG